MSRILFAWELGGGVGHLAAFRPVAEALLARGHQLTLAVRDINSAAMVFNGSPVRIVPAPVCAKQYGRLADPPLNFSEILMRYGYVDSPMLAALLRGWRGLLELTQAERLVADHAPTALLASRGLNVGRLTFGNPFAVPPVLEPLPGMRPWMDVPARRLQDSDAAVVNTVNAALAPGTSHINAVHQLFDGTEHLFVGIPELDPYGPREAGNFLGLHTGSSGSAVAEWPQGRGPRIFAYVKAEHPYIDVCLAALAAAPAQCLVNLAGATPEIVERHRGPQLLFSTGHVDIGHVLSQCDVVVCHSGLGTVNAALRAGKPLLLLPTQLEQFLLASNVEKLGAGRVLRPDMGQPDVAGALGAMLADPAYALSAQAVSRRCSEPSASAIIDNAVSRIEARAAAPIA